MNVKLLLNKQAKEVYFLQRLLPVMMFFLLSATGLQAQTVTSDKDDYVPGEIAIITGSGWTLDEYVDVHFEEEPVFHAEHQHDYHGIKVSSDGSWTISYPIEERHLGVAFTVHVIGKQSGAEAFTYFTDGDVRIQQVSNNALTNTSPTTNITVRNFESSLVSNLIVRIYTGQDIVWESATFDLLTKNAEKSFLWDGTYSTPQNRIGKVVPNGIYTVQVVEKGVPNTSKNAEKDVTVSFVSSVSATNPLL